MARHGPGSLPLAVSWVAVALAACTASRSYVQRSVRQLPDQSVYLRYVLLDPVHGGPTEEIEIHCPASSGFQVRTAEAIRKRKTTRVSTDGSQKRFERRWRALGPVAWPSDAESWQTVGRRSLQPEEVVLLLQRLLADGFFDGIELPSQEVWLEVRLGRRRRAQYWQRLPFLEAIVSADNEPNSQLLDSHPSAG
jgi:hypothetical protein